MKNFPALPLQHVVVHNKIFRDSYEESERWFFALPHSLVNIFHPLSQIVLALDLYESEPDNPIEYQNFLLVLKDDPIDDGRDQLISIDYACEIKQSEFQAAELIQNISLNSVYSWDNLKQVLFYKLHQFLNQHNEYHDILSSANQGSNYKHKVVFYILINALKDLPESEIENKIDSILFELEAYALAAPSELLFKL